MKKRISLAIVISLALLAGCAKTTQTAPQQNSQQPSAADPSAAVTTTATSSNAPAATSPSAKASSSPDAAEEPEKGSYSVETATYSKDKIHIEYPQLKGLGNADREKAVNALIKADILKSQVYDTIQSYKGSGMDITLDVDLKYQVTLQTSDLLSIKYTGTAYVEGGVHPDNVFRGVTVDLKNAAKLKLSDFTEIDDSLAQKVRQSKSVTNSAVENGGDKKALLDALSTQLQEDTGNMLLWGLRNQSDDNFYLTPNALFVMTTIMHAAGDYALIEIPGHYTAILTGKADYDAFLSSDTENLIMSFKTVNSGKTVSIMVSTGDTPNLIYRFGTRDKIELTYPTDAKDTSAPFKYEGKSGSQYSLTFEKAGYEYRIYQDFSAGSQGTTVGVKVTELSTGKTTDLKGQKSSLIGSLIFIDDGQLKNVEKAQQ